MNIKRIRYMGLGQLLLQVLDKAIYFFTVNRGKVGLATLHKDKVGLDFHLSSQCESMQ